LDGPRQAVGEEAAACAARLRGAAALITDWLLRGPCGTAVDADGLDPPLQEATSLCCPVALCGLLLGYPVVYDLRGPYGDGDVQWNDAAGCGNCLANVPLTIFGIEAAVARGGCPGTNGVASSRGHPPACLRISFSVPCVVMEAHAGDLETRILAWTAAMADMTRAAGWYVAGRDGGRGGRNEAAGELSGAQDHAAAGATGAILPSRMAPSLTSSQCTCVHVRQLREHITLPMVAL
jgi:hypothetical protein